MNVTELARKLRLNSQELLEILPEFGFDIGKKAIKVDEKIARKIIELGTKIKDRLERQKEEKQKESKVLAQAATSAAPKREIEIPPVITVREFAVISGRPVNEIIKELMKNGVLASLNERIDFDTAAIIADEFGIKLIQAEGVEVREESGQKIKAIIEKEKKENLKPRAPVIVVMGHVDHGKTKLLDTIRKTHVVEGEAGGITQHIGAYQTEKNGRLITFIDTPGHEAFTAMRSRGAKAADIAILVIAANDSIKPQTEEAIKIIQQSKIPMIVAINKIDLPEANIEKVKQDLSSRNLTPEDWGGKTITVEISAKQNMGIDNLLETILLVAEMEKDKIVANPDKEAVGTIIESHIDKGEGPVATVLVQNGTLNLGDNLCGNDIFLGRARALKDYKNADIQKAQPSVPVKIIGLKYAPKVGDIVEVVAELQRKHKKAKAARLAPKETAAFKPSAVQQEKEEQIKKLNVIIKADVLGSSEAISESLEKIESQEVKANIIAKGLGNITDSDINLAESAKAVILAFHVRATPLAENLAREKNVPIYYYDVIYKLIEEVKEKLSAMLQPEIVRTDLGKVKVLEIFKSGAKNMVIGGKVMEGIITSGAKAEVLRKKELITSGEIAQLQSAKQEVREVAAGQECGINFSGRPEIEKGDILQIFQEEEVIKKL